MMWGKMKQHSVHRKVKEILQKTNCHNLLSSKSFKKKYMVVSGIQKIKNFRKFSVPKVEKKHMVKS